jgi:hypothetical protein
MTEDTWLSSLEHDLYHAIATDMSELHHAADIGELQQIGEAPHHPDVLPDGTPTVIYGNPQGDAQFNHLQGDNSLGFQEDCGLVSDADILDQFGKNVTEDDVVQHAVQNGECYVNPFDPSQSGGTTAESQAQILKDYGVPAHVKEAGTLDSLAKDVQDGKGVIIEVNAGVLWNDPSAYQNGQANHAIVVTGVARDPHTGQIQGFYINDSGDGKSAQFVDAQTMEQAWVNAGGESVVTDNPVPNQ